MKRQTILIFAATIVSASGWLAAQQNDVPLRSSECTRTLHIDHGQSDEDRVTAIASLFRQGKDSINLLIPLINDPTETNFDLLNPIWSNIPPGHTFQQPCGMLAAYLIEVILGRELFHSGPLFPFLGGDPHNYVYTNGDIYGLAKGETFSASVQSQIRAQYAIWWKKNRDRELEDLRRAWQRGERPLSGSRFSWN